MENRPAAKLAGTIVESAARVAIASLVCAIVAAVVKFALVGVLIWYATPGKYLRLQDSVLTGIFTAVAVWAVLMIVRERRKFVLKQVETVASLNHELRNALEVILGSEHLTHSKQGEAILDSVERINRALDKIHEGPIQKD